MPHDKCDRLQRGKWQIIWSTSWRGRGMRKGSGEAMRFPCYLWVNGIKTLRERGKACHKWSDACDREIWQCDWKLILHSQAGEAGSAVYAGCEWMWTWLCFMRCAACNSNNCNVLHSLLPLLAKLQRLPRCHKSANTVAGVDRRRRLCLPLDVAHKLWYHFLYALMWHMQSAQPSNVQRATRATTALANGATL